MPKGKPKKVAQDEMPVPELFLTELETLKKVRIKDGWGTVSFFIKGKIPVWVKDVDVGELKPPDSTVLEKYSKLTLEEIANDLAGTGKEPVKVHTITPVAILSDDRFYIAVQFIADGEEKFICQRVLFTYMLEHFPKAAFYIIHCGENVDATRLVFAKVNNEIVAIVAPISVDSVKTVAPDELLTLFKEWSTNGINDRKDLDKYKHTY